ncbi:MAG TPA: hypothetical protein VFE33_23745 [Thermoanaerobaculia bacterium]|nr:hypothetical protein [Thermoanaerobaculia bacterium]
MNRLPCLAIVLLTVLVTACGGGHHSPSEPAGPDSVSAVSLSPTNGSRLVPGNVVTFSATVNYELQSESSGSILLVVQDQDYHLLTVGPQAKASVNRGRGSATLSDHVTVPAAGVSQVRIYFALVPPDVSAVQYLSSAQAQPAATYPVGS